MDQTNNPDLWQSAWKLLARATVDKKHGFATGTLSTVAKETGADSLNSYVPKSRTVVLRKVDLTAGTLLAYTDARSAKINHLEAVSSLATWCLWDKRSSIQFTGTGTVGVQHGETAMARYRELPKHARKAYATLSAPGSPADRPTDGLPANWDDREKADTDYAARNFTILETTLFTVDILQLSREGHRRLRATREIGGKDWFFTWVTP
ncbi:PNPOx family protein [Neolewinella antarctica]|uniref:Pyridoxamine 5'-phosphate oxidase Alr4036 family FMN-binding domain-containing protein n=1 Tax=Neolewinella antarctica TaxID=442734 RepID=A0ABX0X6C6_9BACT|nr:hypothetical protein [Neolewinella antarctica]NJC24760.1 hypothetical protein [Neolewinella antarctica]